MRLIDADALPRLTQIYEFNGKRMEKEIVDAKFIDTAPTIDAVPVVSYLIDNAPKIDAVPVVRCKDCKWSNVYQADSDFPMERWCERDIALKTVQDNDFCSWGEGKDDE